MNTFRTCTAELGSDDRSCTRRIDGEDKTRCLPLRYGSLIYVHKILDKIILTLGLSAFCRLHLSHFEIQTRNLFARNS
jgi:hypothetical protein